MTQSAHVQQAEPDVELAQPDPFVIRACTLIWWSFGIQLVSNVFKLTDLPPARSLVGALFLLAFVSGVSFWITSWVVSKLKAGRNWMRLLITILFLLGSVLVLSFWNLYIETAQFTVLTGAAAAVQWVLSTINVVLINMPSARSWFLSCKGSARRAA